MIAEGKLLGPKQKLKMEEAVEYHAFDFPDGRLGPCCSSDTLAESVPL